MLSSSCRGRKAGAPRAGDTGGRGEIVFDALAPGRYTIHVESDGFEPYEARDVRVRSGENRREVKLAIARVAESVQVTRDPRERATDPRGDAFATMLGAAEINELARMLRTVLAKLYHGLEDPDFNFTIRSAAAESAGVKNSHWKLSVIPPLARVAGFELGSGTVINTVLPEVAEFLGKVDAENAALAAGK